MTNCTMHCLVNTTQKKFKFIVILGLIITFSFYSCSDDSVSSTNNSLSYSFDSKLVGLWEHVEDSDDVDIVYMSRMLFTSDGFSKSDNWELHFGVSAEEGDEGYGLNKEEAIKLIRTKTWNSNPREGKWKVEGEYLISILEISKKMKYSIINNSLTLSADDGEKFVLEKVE